MVKLSRKVVVRDVELSVLELLSIGAMVLFLIMGSILALHTKPQLVSCGTEPAVHLSAETSKESTTSQVSATALDSTTRDLFKNNRELQKQRKSEPEDKLVQDVKKRKNLMLDQMYTDPDNALKQVLSDTERSRAQSLTKNCVESPSTAEGNLEVIHADFTNNKSAESFVLQTANKERIQLHPANKPKTNLTSGKHIKVKGYRLDNDLLFDAASQDGLTFPKKTALLGGETAEAATSDTLGPQQTIVLMVYFQNTSQPALTQASVNNTVFTQMNNYYQESSYNQMSVTGTSVNWMKIPVDQTCDLTTGIDSVKTAAIAAADPTVNFAAYSRIVIVANYGGFSCGWSGIGTIGKTYVSTADGTVRASVNWVDQSSMGAETHEFGHNLGLYHAEFYNCGSATFSFSGCTQDEYGDLYSPMGSGYTRHNNAPEKEFLGWFNPAQTQTVTANGTYTIEPLETATAGVKSIKIQRSNGGSFGYNYTYYEYRTATGSDTGLSANVLSGSLLHNYTDSYTLLLDATPPGDKNTPALPVGGSFTDPATATKVTLTAKTPTALTFNVALGKTDFSTPTVNLTSPTNDATVSGNVTATSTANSAAGIQKVDFYVDGAENPAFTATTAPYNYLIDTTKLTDGYHYITASATDKSGEAYGVPGNTSGYANVRISVSNDSIAPTVSITSPTNNATVSSSTVLITANATDNTAIARVEFYVDETIRYIAAISPYNYTWDSTQVNNGAHTLMAKAFDNAGNTSSSSPVNVTVSNHVPLYRVWHPASNDHENTTNLQERDWLVNTAGYRSEGITGYISQNATAGLAPLYRVWHPASNDHENTTNLQERDWLVNTAGYRTEGVIGYVYTGP